MKLEKAVDRCFERCNLIGDNCDVIAIMYQYKAIRNLPEKKFDEVYDEIVKSLGFCWGCKNV